MRARVEPSLLTRLAPLLAVLAGCGSDDPGRPPNFLFVSIDSLRADHLSCYGYGRTTSPRIDALAADGMRFARATSTTSWTLPSHASMFTGLPSSVHGCNTLQPVLAPGQVTLAEALGEHGYATAGFWSGPYLHPVFGLGQGFEEYVNCANFEYYAGKQPGKQRRANLQSHGDVTSPKILEAVSAWLRTRDERPFFLFVHMWDVHFDYIPPPPFDTLFDPDYEGPVDGRNPRDLPPDLPERDLEHLIALYDGEIAWTDQHLGAIVDLLAELGLSEDTVVIVTGDHGEEFWEHGKFGHRKTLFEESVGVPLILHGPGRIPEGVVVEERVSVVDIPATILELAGVPAWEEVLGRSLLAPSDEPRVTISELYQQRNGYFYVSLRQGPWDVLLRRDTRDVLGWWNLESDPGQRTNLKGREPLPAELEALVEGALARLEAMDARLAQRRAVPEEGGEPAAVPDDVTESLRALGYLDDEDEEE